MTVDNFYAQFLEQADEHAADLLGRLLQSPRSSSDP